MSTEKLNIQEKLTVSSDKMITLEIATRYLKAKCLEWGLESERQHWISPEVLPDLILTFDYLRKSVGMKLSEILKVTGVRRSTWYSWVNGQPNFVKNEYERKKRAEYKSLLPEEIEGVIAAHEIYPNLDYGRLTQVLGNELNIYVTKQQLKNVLDSKRLRPIPVDCNNLVLREYTPKSNKPGSILFLLKHFIKLPNRKCDYELLLLMDVYSRKIIKHLVKPDVPKQVYEQFDYNVEEIPGCCKETKIIREHSLLPIVNSFKIYMAIKNIQIKTRWSHDYATAKRYGLINRWKLIDSLNKEAWRHLESTAAIVKDGVDNYNSMFPISEKNFMTPDDLFKGEEYCRNKISRWQWSLECSRANREKVNRFKAGQTDEGGIPLTMYHQHSMISQKV